MTGHPGRENRPALVRRWHSINPYETWGKPDPFGKWAGWVYASDADTGAWKWRLKTNYPIQSGMTPTAGGVVFFGDMGEISTLWMPPTAESYGAEKIGGAIGGGVITYTANGAAKSRCRDGSYRNSLANRYCDGEGHRPGAQ